MATREEVGGLVGGGAGGAAVGGGVEDPEGVYIDGLLVESKIRAQLWVLLQSRGFQTVSMVCTLYALFAPDVCYGFLPRSSDNMLLSVVLSVVFFFFILEGVSTVIARPRSVCELFFYLDVVATLSLIADIVWIQEAIAGDASEELTLTRSARLARVGARAARLARMARVLRVLKVVKVTLLAKTSGKRHNIVVDDDEESTSSLPTSIMEQVSDSVTRHVVQIVLVSVIGAAALQYYEENQAASAAFAVMTEASATSRLGQTQIVADTLPNMYYLEISKFDDALIDKTGEQRYQDLRASETITYKTGPDDDCVECIAMVDTSVDKVKQATLNMSLIVLIILVLLVATMSLSRETAQIVLQPTLKVMRMSRTSRALMSVFRAVGDSDGKSGLDDTISTVLDAALKMLSAEVVSMYFVDGDGNLKLHQCACDGAAEGTDVKGRLYGDVLSIGDAQTGTVIGSVITDAKQKFNSEDNTNGRTSSYANLLWVPEMDGVVDMAAHANNKRSMSLRRTMSKLAKGSSSAALQTALIDDEWTGRWQEDPSINSIKLKKAGSSRYVALVGDGPVRNQLCMAVVAEVGGRHRVVGMVQALNRRIAKRHVRYEGDVQLTDLAFNHEDVSSLEVFCMQIADLVQMKLKEAQYEDALNRTDGIGSMLRALELEADGMNASPRLSAAETEAAGPKNHTFKTAAEAVKFATRTSLAGVNAADKLLPIDQLRRWGHGCLDHSRTELTHYTVQMFDDLGLLSEFQVQDASLFEFADRVFSSYNQVPYHNAYHAFNVMQGCYVFCSTMNKGKSLLKTEQFALMVSALGHDSGHDGVNNAFHVGYESEIATLYNDLSPLENMHARRTLGILKEEDIMARIAPAERKAVKAMMVSLIIATDMKFHKDKELKLAEKHEFKVEEDAETRGDAQALMECVLHGIDIGHPTYSWEEECRWARLVATEFQAQVNREEAVSLPTTDFLRCTGEQNLAKGQVGFFQFFVLPYFTELEKHIPELKMPTEQITINKDRFKRVGEGEEQMAPVSARDNVMMAWSMNVAVEALGDDHEEIQKQQTVTVLMTDASEGAPGVADDEADDDGDATSRP